MQAHTKPWSPNTCWFCNYNNPSDSNECLGCRCVALPTRKEHGESHIKWSICLFNIQSLTPDARNQALEFGLAGTDARGPIAVRVHNDTKKMMLVVWHPANEDLYSVEENQVRSTRAWGQRQESGRIRGTKGEEDNSLPPIVPIIDQILAAVSREFDS